MRSGRRGKISRHLREQRAHSGPRHDTDALVAPALARQRWASRLNPRLEIAHRADAVLPLLEVTIPLGRRQRRVGLQVQIVRPVAPRHPPIGNRPGGEVVHRGERGSAFLAGGLAHQRMLAEFGQGDRHHRDGEHARPEAVEVAQRTHELLPVVDARDQHHLRMERDPPLHEPAQLRDDLGRLGIAEQPAPHDRVRRVNGHVQRGEPVLDDPLEIPRLQVGQRGEVAVAKREPVIVVPDVERLAHPLRVAIHEAEIAVVGAAPDPGWLQHDAHRQPFRPFDVILDLLPRGQPRPKHELLVRSQELPVEKVLEVPAIHLEQLGSWDEFEGGTQRVGCHRLYANHG